MKSNTSSSSNPTDQEQSSSEFGKIVISFVLFFHLFCIGLVVCSNVQRSVLQEKLYARLCGPYLHLFGFDLDFTPYYLTHGADDDEDHLIEIVLNPDDDPENHEIITLPDRGSLANQNYRRYLQLADVIAAHAEEEDHRITSKLAQQIGGRIMAEENRTKVIVRCVRRLSQPRDLSTLLDGYSEDPTDPSYQIVLYEADVLLDSNGSVNVLRRASRSEVAPRTGGTSK